MILYPNAKVNIGLDIITKRNDGFHELETVMYPIGLTDILTINLSRSSSMKFTTTGITIDGNPNDNLIVKAYDVVNKKCKLPALDIHLHKSIPFGAGLGGGSADCAFAIVGINELCNLNMSIVEMEKLAAELGSDCPFFIQNKPAIAKGRGEKLELVDLDLENYRFAVIIPPIPISTKLAYSKVSPEVPQIHVENSIQSDINTWNTSIKNDFEHSVFSEFPEIQSIKEKLYHLGALYASLSGSGSAVFGIFKEKPDLEQAFPDSYFLWVN